jgi:oxygen-independent coproporphyrinogen III oxidase
MKLGLYVHIPFCGDKCDYCGFHSVPLCGDLEKRSRFVPRFIDVLTNELEKDSLAARDYNVDTIFFGGGTPSILSPHEIGGILDLIRGKYSVDDDAEITIELNPSNLSRENMRKFADRGINRFTLGVQTMDHDAYRFIGRKGGFVTHEILDEFASFRGVKLGVDIIGGIPRQSLESFISGLGEITDRGIGHLSIYILTLESGSPLGGRIKYTDSDEIEQSELFYHTIQFLEKRGYEHYEISNFAGKREHSRHNLKYWEWKPYLGFGPSAHSFFNDTRYANPMFQEYLDGAPRVYDERSDRMKMAEYIMTGLRLIHGISGNSFREIFGRLFPDEVLRAIGIESEMGNLAVQGSVSEDCSIRIPRERLFIADEVIFKIVRGLL